MLYWIYLLLAIGAEITGTLALKWSSQNASAGGYILMLVMIALSYILLAFSVKRIALGVAYAMWEGIGIILITLFSVVLFNESLSLNKTLGLAILLAGIALIKTGTRAARSGGKAKVKEANHGCV